MKLDNVAIAAISWARTPNEALLVEGALQHLSSMEIPVFVVDGGSSAEFVRRIRSIEGIEVLECQGPGLQHHVVQSLVQAAASGREFLLYTEADKKWFFQRRLAEFLSLAPDDDRVGTIFPSRTPESFATFPPFQFYTETVINNLVGEMIGRAGDYTYGPRLLRASLVPYLQRLRRDVGWGWQSYLLAISHRLGHRIVELTLDIPCPEEQRNEADRPAKLHRLRQLSQHLDGLACGLTLEMGRSFSSV